MGPAVPQSQILLLVGERMGEKIVLIMARRAKRYVAGALNFLGSRRHLRPLLGHDRGAAVSPLRGLLLPGDRVRDRHEARPRRGRCPGRRTSSRAATCRCRPTRRTTFQTRACATRSAEYLEREREPSSKPSSEELAALTPFRKDGIEGETMADYDANNLFAKILRGELAVLQSVRGRQGARFPRHHAARARTHAGAAQGRRAQRLRRSTRRPRPCDEGGAESSQGRQGRVRRRRHHLQQFNEKAGGQVVFHLHVHVIPRKEGVALKPPASEKEKPEVLAEQAEKMKAALA